jgi:soluble lytic murein transglycosylase-like protein
MAAVRILLFCGLNLAVFSLAALEAAQKADELREWASRYEHALGVKQDYAEAYRLYCAAAQLGDAKAAYALGWMYFNGRGVRRDSRLFVGWFKRAAEAGDPYAIRMLLRHPGVLPAEDPGCTRAVPAASALGSNPNRRLVKSWVDRIAPRYYVDPDLALAVIRTESGFNVAAVSAKNALGLMQLIPATAERFGVRDVWNPLENIKGGMAYLHWLLRHFSGNVEWVAAAYNAGEKTVERYQGVPPYRETRNYVKRILNIYPKPVHPIPPPLPVRP